MNKTTTNLQLEAQKTILEDSRTKEHGIGALDKNGVITFTGKVPSLETGQVARTIVANLPGISGVINALEVQNSERETAI